MTNFRWNRDPILRLPTPTLVSLSLLIFPVTLFASEAHICDRAAQLAARSAQMPASVLRAITRVETGRPKSGQLRPWPWTVNVAGKGYWFDSQQQALAFVKTQLRKGATSFDLGCFQINYKWHGDQFHSIDDMMDPASNALYAAQFLQKLYVESGDWTMAAGAYHSRTPHYANKYRARFTKVYQALPQIENPQLPALHARDSRSTKNPYPLLHGSMGAGRLGSLMPQSVQRIRPLLSHLVKDQG